MSDLSPSRCCVALIDLQNDFCHQRGAMAALGHGVERAQASIRTAVRLASLARKAGVPVIHVRTVHSAWSDSAAWVGRLGGGSGTPAEVARAGTWGTEFYGVTPAEDDLVITKHRYSAFASTSLELALQAQGCDTIVLGGTLVNVCVEATAMDGLMRGFYPVLVRDAASGDAIQTEHAAAAKFTTYIGRVLRCDDLRVPWNVQGEDTDSLSTVVPGGKKDIIERQDAM